MSEFQADTLRRLIERYADVRIETARYGRRELPASVRAQLDEAREQLDALISTMTGGRG